MRWTDLATWCGPTENQGGRMVECRGVVVHIAEGTYEGTIAWQKNPAADVSSHFVVDYDGTTAQMVDTDVAAWTQAAGNGHWLSIENAGFHIGQLTSQQVEANAQLLARAHREYGVPLQLADSPDGYGLGWHGMGGSAWGGHTSCPGPANVALLPAIVARAQQILTGTQPAPQGDDMLYAVSGHDGGGQDDPFIWLSNAVTRRRMYSVEEVKGWMNQGAVRFENQDLGWYGVAVDDPVMVSADVDVDELVAALAADPAYQAMLKGAAFEGAQKAERE